MACEDSSPEDVELYSLQLGQLWAWRRLQDYGPPFSSALG